MEAFNPQYRPGGGNKQIFSEKLDIYAASKVEAFNPEYKPSVGKVQVIFLNIDYKRICG